MKIGVTIGDPTGIGPEIVVAACAGLADADLIIYGDVGVLTRAASAAKVPAAACDALLERHPRASPVAGNATSKRRSATRSG